MRYKKPIHTIILLISITLPICAEKGVTIVPVADLVGKPLYLFHRYKKSHHIYKKIPESGSYDICPRIHQLLFNEIVTIVEQRTHEVKVRISNTFYIKGAKYKKYAEYWTDKRNIISFGQLRKKNIDIFTFPTPIDFTEKTMYQDNKNILTLTMPFYDPVTQQTFSVGTRFVATGKQTDKKKEVFVFNHKNETLKKMLIPIKSCFIENGQTKKERMHTFLKILKQWAHLSNGVIPYVLGGCSFTESKKDTFKKYASNKKDNHSTTFTRNAHDYTTKKGLDCSGLIMRAAQACNIPYFLKNTTTIGNALASLQKNEKIHEGDLILIRGHVLVISDVSKNLAIEARGYKNGYGKVHEINIGEFFKEVNTYQDLVRAHHNQQKLSLLDKNKDVASIIEKVKILTLDSIWN